MDFCVFMALCYNQSSSSCVWKSDILTNMTKGQCSIRYDPDLETSRQALARKQPQPIEVRGTKQASNVQELIMSNNPFNLAFRFLLEMAALVAIGYWGFDQHSGVWRFAFGIGGPVIAAAVWATFAVPADASRSGKAPVPVPGVVRLLIELSLFGLATWALFDAGSPTLGLLLASLVIVHYALSYDRVAWLLRQGRGTRQ
jgi:hypothetical protein